MLFQRLAVACLLALTGLIVCVVIARNFLSIGLPRAEELARFCSVSLVFLAAPLLLANNGHICVTFLSRALPPRAQGVISRLIAAFVAVFGMIFLYAGYLFILRAWRFATPAMGIPNWVFYLPVGLGILLTVAVALEQFVAPSPTPASRTEGDSS